MALAKSAEPVARARWLMRRLRLRPGRRGARARHPARARRLPGARQPAPAPRHRAQLHRGAPPRAAAHRPGVELLLPGPVVPPPCATLRDAACRCACCCRASSTTASPAWPPALYDELLSRGVRIYEYTPAFLHAKVALVDDDWATVGSSNIDPLSLLLNLEANVVVRDPPVRRQPAPRDRARAGELGRRSPPRASAAARDACCGAASSHGARGCTCAWRARPGATDRGAHCFRTCAASAIRLRMNS